MKAWQCTVCKYIHKGEAPPAKCPVCGVDASKFVEIDPASIPQKTPRRRKPAKRTGQDPPPKKDLETKTPDIEQTFSKKIKSLLIRHHAHPVLVHTPNGILPAAVIFFFLAWIFDYDLLAKAAFINIIFVMLTLPLVLLTGLLEWKEKYNGVMTINFKFKIIAAIITSVFCAISLVWFLNDPKILTSSKSWIFILTNIIMLISAGVAGYIGGKLVFKD